MPIKIPGQLPAKEILEQENIFVMDEERAINQNIRPLNILILNLMPEKEKAEVQLLRLLGNTPIQVNITFLRLTTHNSKNTSKFHLERFYKPFSEIQYKKYDGLIISGAPVEKLPFEEVNYWEELKQIMNWSKEHVTSTLHICWGAQAALYHHYGINKYELPEKCFGIYEHRLLNSNEKLVRGFDDSFLAPHSRYTDIDFNKLKNHPELFVLAESDQAGILLVASKNGKNIMVTGHLEYDATTLGNEYTRDHERGIETQIPENYFPNNDPNKAPLHRWKSHSNLLFSNWLNYYVYQLTPFEWN
ncbi:homoserine O-succinyltransferase [Bacillaceae bacterium Marseille-Q3522]|nr:homoserine O-succinyltransferase [Bacillaceae bacterium Marseille-Q3522]